MLIDSGIPRREIKIWNPLQYLKLIIGVEIIMTEILSIENATAKFYR